MKRVSSCLYSLVLVGLLAALAVTSVVQQTPSAVAEQATIKVGVLLCLTGICAEWGKSSLDGIKLASEEINSRGGILGGRRIELVVEDSGEEQPARAILAYRAMRVEKNLKFILGPSWTAAGLALAPVAAADNDVLMISPSLGGSGFNEGGEKLFAAWPHDYLVSRYLARFALERLLLKVAVIASDDSWESEQASRFIEEFVSGGGQVALAVDAVVAGSDLRAEISKIVASKPDAVLLSNYRNMDRAARELRQQGYKGQILAILMDQTRIDNADGGLDGAIFSRYQESDPRFNQRFSTRFGTPPGVSAARAYDAMMVLAQAVSIADSTDPERVAQTLINMPPISGVSGEFDFDHLGAVGGKPEIWVVRGRTMEPLA